LASELRARGHDVLVETFERWRELVEELEIRFVPAVERMAPLERGAEASAPTLAEATRELEPLLGDWRPDVVVHDMWTLAPAFAADVAGVTRATLIPHPYPAHEPGLPFYTLGAFPSRTSLGRAVWRGLWPAIGTRLPNTRLRRVKAELDAARAELGLAPFAGVDGQISETLALVATFPQLEYPRRWPAHVHVTGPMLFERPHPVVELPEGTDPLVVVALSTERDPERELGQAALDALEGEPVRVAVSLNRRGMEWAGPIPANAAVFDWVSYAQLLPLASMVICHGGHGTVARSLVDGVPVLVSPRAGDQAENGARVAWSGAGLMLPRRLAGAWPLRRAARRLLADGRFAARAAEIAEWARRHPGPTTAAELIERLPAAG
jgi:UDP:flavonoid glycosyltransferase YjiC (YdhE family)